MDFECAVIIVAAGNSRRMGFDKLMAPLGGVPVLQHSINVFASLAEVKQLVVVTSSERWRQIQLDEVKCEVIRTEGGAERADSVAAGVAKVNSELDLVAVHDGARPFIKPSQILACLAAAAESGGAVSAHPVTDTLKRVDPSGAVVSSVARDNLWAMETPQVFQTHLIRQAYAVVTRLNPQARQQITDEVSALALIDQYPTVVANPYPNPKITYPQDLQS